jgi:hypothetical protein
LRRLLVTVLAGGCLIALAPSSARADDLQPSAERLSNGAFALLESTSAGAEQVRGAIATFAGDAETLASALGGGQQADVASAMAALVGDEKAVDQAAAKNPGALDVGRWRSIESDFAELRSRLPPAWRAASARRSSGSGSPNVVAPPPEEISALGPAPQAIITYRVWEDGGVRVKGYFEGQDLRSAGIYDGDTLLAPVNLSDMSGHDRVDFNFGLDHVSPTEVVRVTDSLGRTAQAVVAPEASVAASPPGSTDEKMIELGTSAIGSSEPETPAMVASRGTNTIEIPSKSPSRRHLHSRDNSGANLSPPTDVQINVLGVTPSQNNSYQVVGQISGEGIKRAGIYVDGRLVTPIPVAGGQYASFNVSFTMLGKSAAIRVYGNGNNYVESELDLSSAAGGVYGLNPPVVPINPYAYRPNPYAPAYPYGSTLNPYGSANPYAPAPYGYGPPLSGYAAPRPARPSWPFP